MDYDVLFGWCGYIAMLGWGLLILSPRRYKWLLITTGILIPALLGTLYGGLMLANFTLVEGAGYSSLNQVRALLSQNATLLGGWVHYLSFDLIVGTLIAQQADKERLSRLIQIPILLMTFLFGPLGFVLFVLVKASWRITASLQHTRIEG